MENASSEAFGRNRLASGFVKPTQAMAPTDTPVVARGPSGFSIPTQAAAETDTPVMARLPSSFLTFDKSPMGDSPDSPISISDDDEIAESEGGIVLNFEDQNITPTAARDQDEESGEYRSDESMTYSPKLVVTTPPSAATDGDQTSFMIDPIPTGAVKKLADLAPQQRDDQLKYAFYHLARDEVDLSRPVICLRCFDEGHMHEDCSQKTMFPAFKCAAGRQAKLWISCCVCASKDHLVGDCPHADTAEVKRWSLADVDSKQIINLSLETGTRRHEREAENRGMRPPNLSIKGRASRHTAGIRPQHDQDSSEEEPFLHNKRMRNEDTRHARYDRFDAPSGPSNPGRGGWYATDSFGQRRSRSPLRREQDRERRSPQPRGDTWRPMTAKSDSDSWRPAPGAAPTAKQIKQSNPARSSTGLSNGAKPVSLPNKPPFIPTQNNNAVTLPTRKGSNTWTSNNSSNANNSTTRAAPSRNGGKRGPRRRRGK